MKNKIFELYKPKSLADFLSFKQENPKENFVYVLQHPPANINILGASDFGYLVICLPNFGPDSQIIFSSSPFVFKMQKKFKRCKTTRLCSFNRRSCSDRNFLCYCKRLYKW